MKIIQAQTSPLHQLLPRHGLMQSVNDLVVNVGGGTTFEASYLPVLERFCDRIQELPLQKASFADLGGALICGVRASTLAVRTCDATIFAPNATAAERLTNDSHYRWLAYSAALANVYLITAASVDVHRASDLDDIYSWADDTHLIDWCGKDGYQMSWVDKPLYAFPRLAPYLPSLLFPGQFAHLPRQLISDFGAALNPSLAGPSAEQPLARVVRQSIERIITDEKALIAGWVAESGAAPKPPANTTSAPSPSPSIDPSTGEIADAATESILSPEPPKESHEQIKAREWLTAIGCNPALAGEAILQSDGKLQLSRKALAFGAVPSTNYKLLHAAGFVDSKQENSATLTKVAAEIFAQAQARSKESA